MPVWNMQTEHFLVVKYLWSKHTAERVVHGQSRCGRNAQEADETSKIGRKMFGKKKFYQTSNRKRNNLSNLGIEIDKFSWESKIKVPYNGRDEVAQFVQWQVYGQGRWKTGSMLTTPPCDRTISPIRKYTPTLRSYLLPAKGHRTLPGRWRGLRVKLNSILKPMSRLIDGGVPPLISVALEHILTLGRLVRGF